MVSAHAFHCATQEVLEWLGIDCQPQQSGGCRVLGLKTSPPITEYSLCLGLVIVEGILLLKSLGTLFSVGILYMGTQNPKRVKGYHWGS